MKNIDSVRKSWISSLDQTIMEKYLMTFMEFRLIDDEKKFQFIHSKNVNNFFSNNMKKLTQIHHFQAHLFACIRWLFFQV